MKLYYHAPRRLATNFGDMLNPWLWHRLMPGILDDDGTSLFIGIGTLLNNRIPQQPFKAVFGTGVGYGQTLPVVDERWRIYCVRGPLSAHALALDKAFAITDPAALLRTLDLEHRPKTYRASFMPHCDSTLNWDWGRVCRDAGIHYIDPLAPVDAVLDDILRSELVVAEAMHGAIVADALRVPWIAVRSDEHILEFKWRDWCSSLGVTYAPFQLPAVYSVESATLRLSQRAWGTRMGRGLGRLGMGKEDGFGRLLSGSISQSAGRVGRVLDSRSAAQLAMAIRGLAESQPSTLSTDGSIESATSRLEDRLDAFRQDFWDGVYARG